MEDVSDLGGVGVAGEREATGGERELGGADGGDAEHGQVGGAPLVVGAAVAAVRLPGLLGGQIHRRHRWKRKKAGSTNGSGGLVVTGVVIGVGGFGVCEMEAA